MNVNGLVRSLCGTFGLFSCGPPGPPKYVIVVPCDLCQLGQHLNGPASVNRPSLHFFDQPST